MKTITRSAAIKMLEKLDKGTPAGIVTQTQPKMRKRGNPFSTVERIAHRNVFLGVNYESCVNNKQERDGGERDFESKPLPWGEHAGRYFILHKGKYYLKFYPTGGKPKEEWKGDGRTIDKSEVEPFLYSSSGESPIPWRTVALENVNIINVNKESYHLIG